MTESLVTTQLLKLEEEEKKNEKKRKRKLLAVEKARAIAFLIKKEVEFFLQLFNLDV